MAVKFSNNASTELSAAITTSATSVTVSDSSELPTLSAGDHTYVTIANAGGTKIEIVKVTAIVSNTLTVVRGQDNTSALAFNAGDLCELRLTAALLTDSTAEQTGAEIKTAYQAEANAFTDTQFTKLAGIETSATADQTGAEIKTAYQSEANAFTDTQFTKLAGIEALADVTDATNVAAAGALMDSELAGLAAVKATTGTFLTADQTKLDGIATSANNYTHPSADGDLHVPATSTTNNGKYLQAGTTPGSMSWQNVDALPSQTGQDGKYLGTNGSTATWNTLDTDANSTTKGLYEMKNTIGIVGTPVTYVITTGNNALSAGPITIESSSSVTIPSGSTWVIA